MSYVGTTIGAGFASGREIWNFFVKDIGNAGIKGVFLAGFFLVSGGIVFLNLSRLGQYDHLIYRRLGRKGAALIDLIFIFLLTGSVLVMGTGGGALFREVFHFSFWSGNLLTFIIMGFFACFGAEGVRKFNFYFIPFLIVYLLVASIGFKNESIYEQITVISRGDWVFKAVLFSAYNLLFAFPALLAVGRDIEDRSVLWAGGILGGIILTILLFSITTAFLHGYSGVEGREMPGLIFVGWLGVTGKIFFYLVLWIALLSTGIVNLYTLASRLKRLFTFSLPKIILMILTICLPFATLGFSTLVNLLYPFYGYLALFVFSLLVFRPLKKEEL